MLREEKREIREMGEVEAGDDDGSGRVTLNPFGRWLMTLTFGLSALFLVYICALDVLLSISLTYYILENYAVISMAMVNPLGWCLSVLAP